MLLIKKSLHIDLIDLIIFDTTEVFISVYHYPNNRVYLDYL